MPGGNPKSIIKSIQRGTCKISNTSVTININTINTNTSILFFNFTGDNYSYTYRYYTFGELSEDKIIFKLGGERVGNININYTVIEFDQSFVKSVQRGICNKVSSVTINNIDILKSFEIVSFGTDSSNYAVALNHSLSNNSIIFSNIATGINKIAWQVIEFK